MDPHYDGKPSMISETTFNRPNRYRSEAPLYYAAYRRTAGQRRHRPLRPRHRHWSVKPGYFMQPWTLMSPAMMGQFPAAALILPQGPGGAGRLLVNLNLKVADIVDLKGTPMPQDAAFDELRLKDVPKGTRLKPDNVIDPLVHYAGRTNVNFSETGGPPKLVDLAPYIDTQAQTVTSTTGQLKLDYGKGVLTINAPAAQGLSGNLKPPGAVELEDLSISSRPGIGPHRRRQPRRQAAGDVVANPAPGDVRGEAGPLSDRTRRQGIQRITNLGHDPWIVKNSRAS